MVRTHAPPPSARWTRGSSVSQAGPLRVIGPRRVGVSGCRNPDSWFGSARSSAFCQFALSVRRASPRRPRAPLVSDPVLKNVNTSSAGYSWGWLTSCDDTETCVGDRRIPHYRFRPPPPPPARSLVAAQCSPWGLP